MNVIDVIIIGFCGVLASNLLKRTGSEYSVLCLIATGLLIIITLIASFSDVILSFQSVFERSGLNNDLVSGVLKITGIGYLTEYSSSLCKDSGAVSVGDKIVFAGKITIFILSFPIINALIELLMGIAKC